jgi:hypothetical protein
MDHTCAIGAVFKGIKVSARTVGDGLQARPTAFQVPPHCAAVDLPKLLGLKSKWLNPVPSVSGFDIGVSGAQVGGRIAVHWGGKAASSEQGSQLTVTVDDVKGVVRGKVMLEVREGDVCGTSVYGRLY